MNDSENSKCNLILDNTKLGKWLSDRGDADYLDISTKELEQEIKNAIILAKWQGKREALKEVLEWLEKESKDRNARRFWNYDSIITVLKGNFKEKFKVERQ